jgi:hypothetical protein
MRRRTPALLAAGLILAVVLALSPLAEAVRQQVLPRNSVGTDQIRAGAVTRGKIRNGHVTSEKIKQGAITTNLIRDGAVTTDKIRNGAVTPIKLAQLPAAGVSSGRNQTVAPSTDVALSFEQVRFNQAGVYNASSPTRLTAPVTGIYLASAGVAWGLLPGDNNARRLSIRRNGTTIVSQVIRTDTNPDVRVVSNVTEVLRLSAGEFVEVVVSHGAAQAIDIVPIGELSPEFQLAFMSPAA